jgi:hypothetical protein
MTAHRDPTPINRRRFPAAVAGAYVYGEGRARGVNDDGFTADEARRPRCGLH